MLYQPTWNNPYVQQSLPQYAGYQPTVTQAYQQPVNGVIKVSGPNSALQYGYRLPPNSTSQPIFDNNGKVFYVVSTDGAGVPSIETFDFSPHVEEAPVTIDGAQFVSRVEFDEFTKKVNAALGAINGLHAAVPATVPAAGTTDGATSQNVAAPLDAAR